MGSRRGESARAVRQPAAAAAEPVKRPAGGAVRPARAGDELIQLQRSHGNRCVQRHVEQHWERQADRVARAVGRGVPVPPVSRAPLRAGAAAPGVRRAVERARGGGRPVPDGVRGLMERAFGADFGAVRVHADARADALNRQLAARAFTAGSDIFFRRGDYALGTPGGREVLAHELTHVMQQRGAAAIIQRDPVTGSDGTVTDPNIPGATLTATGGRDSTGDVEYIVNENNVLFKFNETTKVYTSGGVAVDPALLAPSAEPPKEKRQDKPEEPKEQQAKKKKQRTDDPYFSEMEESDDDSTTQLTREQQFDKMTRLGKLKRRSLRQVALRKQSGAFLLHHPHQRKAYAARRTKSGDPMVDIGVIQSGLIGHQYHNFMKGTGHFVTAGGNKESRPVGVKEPPEDYKGLFEAIKALGKDKNAKTLLTLAGDPAKIEGGTLTDRQVAVIVLLYMNTEAGTTLPRTQLTENLEKLMAIFASETARTFESVSGPYDASLFIKATLKGVIDNEFSLQKAFYHGKGGATSVFLGAPSGKHSDTEIGGAEQLRDPLSHKEAFEQQMSLFPIPKDQFKEYISGLKTGTTLTLPVQTEDDIRKAKQASAASQVEEANLLLETVKKITVPKRIEEVNDFLTARTSPLAKGRRAVNDLRKRAAGNDAALAVLDEVVKVLTARLKQAKAKVGA
jgi:hypothetical protein